MIKRKWFLAGLLGWNVAFAQTSTARQVEQETIVTSPDGSARITLTVKRKRPPYESGRRLYYSVKFKTKPVVLDSPLSLLFQNQPALEEDFEWVKVVEASRDETYSVPAGPRKTIRNHFREKTISLRESAGAHRSFEIVLRAYDEGIAFRWIVPRQEGLETVALKDEHSTFYLPPGCTAWALQLGKFTSSYEAEFDKLQLWQIRPDSIIGLPLLVKTNQGSWLAITEANITHYAGMYLSAVPGVPDALTSCLSPLPSDKNLSVKGVTPIESPWRVILLGESPGRLIENNYLLLNLNEPCAIADTSWIKPGKAAWNWWSGTVAKGVDFKPGMNTPTMKHYIDFAGENRLEYLVVDAGWYEGGGEQGDITRMIPAIDIPELVRYGRARNVGIILWLYWSRVAEQIDKAFPLYEQWGVKGVKIDFMDRDDQEMVAFYHRVARKAAQHRLLVDFHGAYKPDGLQRTWPNLITREGVLGLEYNKWSRRVTPLHDVTLPFTRMLAGPMDYTPGAFRNASRQDFRPVQREPMSQGTRCHQLAMYVVYDSPLQMLADYPEAYRNQAGFEFLRQVPTTWDDIHVLDGQVGEFISLARRHGQDWYLGSMTNWQSRTLQVPLRFLGNKKYWAEIYSDADDASASPSHVTMQKKLVSPSETLTIKLAEGGGLAARFTPASRQSKQ